MLSRLLAAIWLPLSLTWFSLYSISSAASDFKLRSQCPPSFEKTSAGVCKLRTMYQFYDSVQGRGLGGTQTSLPVARDGFSPEKIDLGRYLFFDPLLSKDGSVSCASCHQPDKGFADGMDRSIGITGEKVSRSAPSLWNVAFIDRFFWDGRATTLEQQAMGPLFDPKEMGNTPEKLVADISANPVYKAMFTKVFDDNKVSVANISEALAAFQTSLISLNSRYDQYAHGYHQALSENEIKGLNIFRSFVARCAECHQPPLFTNNQIAVIGTPDPEGMAFDVGAEATFNDKRNRGGFKVPTLRNIGKTAPYMHSGKFDSLNEATEFYNKGRGHAVPEDEELLIHWHIWEPNLRPEEIDLIVEFLHSLNDESLTPQLPESLPSGLPVVDQKYAANKQLQQQLQQQEQQTIEGEEDDE
ncbi:cytochrome c peroxidase [Thalassotalea sp. Y01]|uniref:cytochrome-c peroxidase n=1 Tax=Thalassotalea sp. Y01 TaxID=2729613 RepID=UPI00145D9E3B|nr:cytochrome c peroxidase [Thalassotalea sp. Y01]NMP17599.1 c-type cytochrome [Thalassotalea sp. Y01]